MLDTESAAKLFMRVLSPALGVHVSQPPADIDDQETWCTFNEVPGTFAGYASNEPQRIRHLVQLHIFSRREDGEHKRLYMQALALLRPHGVRCRGWDLDDYDDSTHIHHIAGTCEWVERINANE